MITAAATTVMADGFIDTATGLASQGKQAIIGLVSAVAAWYVLKEFMRGGAVAGIVAVVIGAIVWWGVNSMDLLKDDARDTYQNASAEPFTHIGTHTQPRADHQGGSPTRVDVQVPTDEGQALIALGNAL